MKRTIFTLTILIFCSIALLKTYRPVLASEGTVELESQTGKDYRCFAASMLVKEYKILIRCTNLIYPAGSYVVWANPKDDSKPEKLGKMDFGRKEFSAKKAFSSLFITLEKKSDVKSPTGPTIMHGKIEPISFLEKPSSPTPTPKEGEKVEEEKPEETKQETLSTKDKLVLAFKRAGVAAVLALVGLIGVIFIIARSRG